MIRSMTGFGRAERAWEDWTLCAEARSLNHRELKISLRLPEALRFREAELHKLVEARVRRGHIYLSLACERRGSGAAPTVDEQCVAHYLRALKRVAEAEGLPPNIELASLLGLPGTLKELADEEHLRQALWPQATAVVQEALDALVRMREAEGEHLRAHLESLCSEIESVADAIAAQQGAFVAAYQERLRQRVEALLRGSDVHVTQEALAREVAIYADRCDVSEEIARIHSHLAQFRQALLSNGKEPVGRMLEFLCQELLREASTTAAKAPAWQQVQLVMQLRGRVEQLREQVRNVE